ncbi:MAG: cobalamin-binding protein [Candidatus Eremiobacteraeota bacterium]|nr:cobalamin-binding protein [Candidatus Eremiobacteraeota bacterium]
MRIVGLLPSATEILFALGLGDDVVGVTHECDYPPEVLEKPKLTRSNLPQTLQTHPGSQPVAVTGRSAEIDRHVRANVHAGSSLYALDSDLLERLGPDLIVTQELCAVCAVSYDIVAGAAKRLRADPRVISLEPNSLEDVFGTIASLAQITGVPERAARLLELLRAAIAALRLQTRAVRKPRTLLLEWTDPPMSAGHWIPDLIELAGGEPVLANPGANSQVLDWDAIAQADPDAILVAPCGYDLKLAKSAVEEIHVEPDWAGLRAVRTGRAFAIDGSAYVNRPGPRLVRTAEIFAHALHGDAIPGPLPFGDALARV